MRYTRYLLFVLALVATSSRPALAQGRQPVYQPIETASDEAYPLPLTAPLHVLLPSLPSEEDLRGEFKKPTDRAAYLESVTARRAALEIAARSWHLSPVQLISTAEFNTLKDDKAHEHLVLYFGTHDYPTQRAPLVLPALGLARVGHVVVPGFMGAKRTASFHEVAFQLFNSYSRLILAGPAPAWHTVFHPSDFISSVQQLQVYLAQRAQGTKLHDINRAAEAHVGQLAALLQSKTLLLAPAQLQAKLTETKLRQLYPYPTQLTDRAAVEAAVASADPRYLYLRFITVNGHNGFQLLDAASGQLVGYADFIGVRHDSFGQLEADDLQELVKTASPR